jgi:hypothetical protein
VLRFFIYNRIHQMSEISPIRKDLIFLKKKSAHLTIHDIYPSGLPARLKAWPASPNTIDPPNPPFPIAEILVLPDIFQISLTNNEEFCNAFIGGFFSSLESIIKHLRFSHLLSLEKMSPCPL